MPKVTIDMPYLLIVYGKWLREPVGAHGQRRRQRQDMRIRTAPQMGTQAREPEKCRAFKFVGLDAALDFDIHG